MGFFDWIKSAVGKVADGIGTVVGKVSDGAKWLVDKARGAIDYARDLPIIGNVVRAAEMTPLGQAISNLAQVISPTGEVRTGAPAGGSYGGGLPSGQLGISRPAIMPVRGGVSIPASELD